MPDGGIGIEAPLEQWTWIPLDGVTCGNGSPSGIGVNLTDRSDDVMIFFQGGGACWDALTCFTLKSAINIETTYNAARLEADTDVFGASYLGKREADNPIRDASWIFVPYCTGDLHDGTRMATYDVLGTPRTVHHVGSLNAAAIFAAAAATRPDAETVWLIGASAGGYGVTYNIGAARTAFPGRPVHTLADCSPMVTIEPTRWQTMQTEWAMKFPPTCTTCTSDMGAVAAAITADAKPGDRYGLLAYTRDSVIATFFGLNGDQLRSRTLAEQAAFSGNQAAYVLEGTEHVMLGNENLQTSTNVVLKAWVAQWASGVGWANAGP
jgi:Pectinacetylesterase